MVLMWLFAKYFQTALVYLMFEITGPDPASPQFNHSPRLVRIKELQGEYHHFYQMAELDGDAITQHLKKEGFTTGKVGMIHALQIVYDFMAESLPGRIAAWILEFLKTWLTLLLDTVHTNSELIRNGAFKSTINAEWDLIKSSDIKTVGGLMNLIKEGKLSMLTMLVVTALVVFVFSATFIELVLKLLNRAEYLDNGGKARTTHSAGNKEEEEEEEAIELRDFTIEQLRVFDGRPVVSPVGGPPGAGAGSPKNGEEPEPGPIYISLRGNVYDVTSAADFYGPGQAYHCMAGREASRALAKLSFEEEDLSSTDLSDLGPFARETLDGWEEKFIHYKCYPVVGKCVFDKTMVPPYTYKAGASLASLPKYTVEDIAPFTGTTPVSADSTAASSSSSSSSRSSGSSRINPPIYLGICGMVLDVSFGGTAMYGPGGPYHRFAGKDASRCLAKMSFKPEDIDSEW